jgi:nicotinate-nucleotide--dimethylbenzimidazole phosphoribosyltransferase
VTNELPPEVEAVKERITLPGPSGPETPEPGFSRTELPPAITGELRALLSWWRTVSDGSPPNERHVEPDADLPASAATAMLAGLAAADRAIDGGATLLIPRVVLRDDIAARSLVAVLTRLDASVMVPQPEGMPDSAWMEKVTAIRDASYRLSFERAEPVPLLDAAATPGIAFLIGVLLNAAARRTPCILDGTDELAAALVADRISAGARAWWICGSQSTDPARSAAAERIDPAPGLPLALTDDEGLGAQATLALLRLLTA